MKFTDFKNGLENGKLEFSVYLFEGEDAYFKERGLTLLKNKYLSEPTLNLVNFEGNAEVGEIVSSLYSFPFMSEKRLTVIKEFYPKAEQIKELKDYLDNPTDGSLFIIINDKPCDGLKKFGSVCLIECGKADDGVLSKWIKSKCGSEGVTIDLENAKTICVRCLSDMMRIQNETEKLISLVGRGGVITESIIEENVSADIETVIYKMTDYIARKKFDQAFSFITEMLAKGDTAQHILSSVYNYYRKLLLSAISGKTPSELASYFGMGEYPAKKLKEQSAMFKVRSLKSAVDLLVDADYKFKSGQADADQIMWWTLFKIMTE